MTFSFGRCCSEAMGYFRFILFALPLISAENFVSEGLECPLAGEKSPQIRVGAFNIQNFGKNKMANPEVVDIIVKILSKYNLILIQEIVDKDEKVLGELVDKLNSECDDDAYDYTISPRVGRTIQQEQYAYIYSKDYLRLNDKAYVYHDNRDIFEREPYVATFKKVGRASKNKLSKFSVIGIHTKPAAALIELQNLHHVAEHVAKTSTPDIMIMGDFNADCTYVRKKKWSEIPLWTNKSYEWLIDAKTDTTTSPSDCAYDRIVVTGSKMKRAIVKDSAGVVRFDEMFDLTDEQAQAVSDHYPVEVLITI